VAVCDRSFVPHPPLLNVELDRMHAVWGRIQTVESEARYTLPVWTGRLNGPFKRVACIGLKSETDYCELISQCELISHTVGDFWLVLSTFFTGIWPLLHCPLPHCPPLPHGAALSTPAMSTLATSCWFVHSYKFHPCNMMPNCPLLLCPLPQIQCPQLTVECISAIGISDYWANRLMD